MTYTTNVQSRRPVERIIQGTKRPLRTGNETSWERKVHKPPQPCRLVPAWNVRQGRRIEGLNLDVLQNLQCRSKYSNHQIGWRMHQNTHFKTHKWIFCRV